MSQTFTYEGATDEKVIKLQKIFVDGWLKIK